MVKTTAKLMDWREENNNNGMEKKLIVVTNQSQFQCWFRLYDWFWMRTEQRKKNYDLILTMLMAFSYIERLNHMFSRETMRISFGIAAGIELMNKTFLAYIYKAPYSNNGTKIFHRTKPNEKKMNEKNERKKKKTIYGNGLI